MNLPHQEPILFAQKIEKIEENKAVVSLKFPFVPTLAMMIEAAAQSCIAFNKEEKIGFVVSLKDVKLQEKATYNELVVRLNILSQVEPYLEVGFEVLDKEQTKSFASGAIVLKTETTKEEK